MNNEQVIKPRYRNKYIVPVFSIAFLIIATITVSFGYLSTSSSMGSTQHNINLARKCVLNVQTSTGSVTVNKNFLRFDDPISAGGQYGVGSTSSSYIKLNGGTDCSCKYNVVLKKAGSYVRTSGAPVASEYVYNLEASKNGAGGTNAVSIGSPATYDIGELPAGTTIGSGTITVVTAGTEVTHTWTYSQKFYNLMNYNQIAHQGKTYTSGAEFVITGCTFSDTVPSGYTKLEYISNNQPAYIDTGYKPNYNNNIEIEIVYMPSAASKRYCLMSNYNGASHMSLELNTSNKGRFYYNNAAVDVTAGTVSTSTKNTYKITYTKSSSTYSFDVNGTVVSGTMSGSGSAASNMLLFVDQSKRFSTFPTAIKIYSVRITENGVPLRNMVACKRNSNNAIGMCDLVNGVFYANANSSGSFTAGPTVS